MSVRARLREPVSSRRFLQLAAGTVLILGLVVTSGAFVRLTGSGLGCDNWPRCGSTPFPALSFHPMIEFGNRVVSIGAILASLATWHASRRVAGLPRWVVFVALGAFLGTVAQIPLGGITVILELHPLAVMSHFLLALVVVAGSVVVMFEAWSRVSGGLGAPVAPRWLRLVALVGVLACAAMVVTGAIATASGPHPGADQDVHRLGLGIRDTVYVHVRATAVFGIGLLLVGWQLVRSRREVPGVVRLALVLLAVLAAQMLVGEIQYRDALPWGLVLVHVTLAATIWGLTVGVVYAVWRPPLALVASVPERTERLGEPLQTR